MPCPASLCHPYHIRYRHSAAVTRCLGVLASQLLNVCLVTRTPFEEVLEICMTEYVLIRRELFFFATSQTRPLWNMFHMKVLKVKCVHLITVFKKQNALLLLL